MSLPYEKADDGNRTHLSSLGSSHSTDELHPHCKKSIADRDVFCKKKVCHLGKKKKVYARISRKNGRYRGRVIRKIHDIGKCSEIKE